MENFNTEHAQPISDEDLQWVEELLPTADGNVLAPMLMMQRMAARIRELEARLQVNEEGVIAELRGWLKDEDMHAIRRRDSRWQNAIFSVRVKLDSLVAQLAGAGASREPARAEQVAEAKRVLEWTQSQFELAAGAWILLEPGDLAERYVAAMEYVASQEQAGG